MVILSTCLKKNANPVRNLLLQEGDPSENSVKARSAYGENGVWEITIPAEENILTLSKTFFILDRPISWEDFAAFSTRFKTTLQSIPIDTVMTTTFHEQEILWNYDISKKERESNTCFLFTCKCF